jgi:capsular exopolysaccharide synthesis family protein
MSDMEKYQGQVIRQQENIISEHPIPGSEDTVNIAAGILRRWYLVLLIFIIVCLVGIPAIWLGIEPIYNVTGAIRVAPIIPNILTGEADSGGISNYWSFVNTQAAMITSGNVVERVADELVEKQPSFFQGHTPDLKSKLKQELKGKKVSQEPAAILRSIVNSGAIKASADKNTELIRITMESTNPEEAKLVVDTFIKSYMAIEGSASAQDEDRNLRVLEDERKVVAETLERQRDSIHKLAQEYGSTTLTSRQDMMLQRVSYLLGELTKAEAKRMNLEAQLHQLEQKSETSSPQKLLGMRDEYINSDPTVQELNKTIVNLEKDLVVAQQRLAPTNPELEHSRKVIEELQKAIEQKKQQLSVKFNEDVQKQISNANQQEILNLISELENVKAYESRLQEKLSKEDSQTIELGRKQLAIKDLQDQLELTKEMHSTIQRRIKELEMERKRPARVSVAYNAEIASFQDKRIKYSTALTFGALACGAMVAFLRDKMDKSLRTPEDVIKRSDIRIIGTTANLLTLEESFGPNQIIEDYQNIRANLGLLNGKGLPKRLIITSPGMREGKTTCSVNLATSIAKSGNKVLLIEGDLRKPSIYRLLHIPKDSRTVQDILLGRNDDNAIYTVASSGLDILVADCKGNSDVYELLSSRNAFQNIEKISLNYDHVIIDTPPVLAFPDALIWAKMADAAILTSFAGQTTAADLREAKKKLVEINVEILGAVLSNVSTDNSYYRYAYNYYSQRNTKTRAKSVNSKLLLLPDDKKSPDSDI